MLFLNIKVFFLNIQIPQGLIGVLFFQVKFDCGKNCCFKLNFRIIFVDKNANFSTREAIFLDFQLNHKISPFQVVNCVMFRLCILILEPFFISCHSFLRPFGFLIVVVLFFLTKIQNIKYILQF